MKDSNDILHTFLTILGFKPEEINVYLTLTQKGALTALELSRTTGISRTQIYRIIEEMEGKGFLEEIIDEHRKLAQAIDIKDLAPLIRQKQTEAVEAERLFPGVRELLEANVGANQADTKVLFYRGKHGLRQMVWHTLRAEKELVGYTYRKLEEYIGVEFMQDWNDTFCNKGLVMRDVYSEDFERSKKIISTQPEVAFGENHFFSHVISEKVLRVNLQMDIYNDVVAQYNWHEGDVFGVEIYNAKTAAFHKQMFEIVWKLGKPMG